MFGMSSALTVGIILILLGAIFMLIAVIGNVQGSWSASLGPQVRKIVGILGSLLLIVGFGFATFDVIHGPTSTVSPISSTPTLMPLPGNLIATTDVPTTHIDCVKGVYPRVTLRNIGGQPVMWTATLDTQYNSTDMPSGTIEPGGIRSIGVYGGRGGCNNSCITPGGSSTATLTMTITWSTSGSTSKSPPIDIIYHCQ